MSIVNVEMEKEVLKARCSQNKQEFKRIHDCIDKFEDAKKNQNMVLINIERREIVGEIKSYYYTDKDESEINYPSYMLRGIVCITKEDQTQEYIDILDILDFKIKN